MENLKTIINTVLKNRGKQEINKINETSHLRNIPVLGFDMEYMRKQYTFFLFQVKPVFGRRNISCVF
jgi:hypothetical protein